MALVMCLLFTMIAVAFRVMRSNWKVAWLLMFLTGWFGSRAVRYMLGP